MAYLLGLDISTTGAKALLIDEKGAVVASHTSPQPISNPRPLWSEQNPADWWSGMAASIRAVLNQTGAADQIAAVGLTGQMHGLVCLDAQNNVLRPAILWNDQRTQAECDWITETIGAERLIQLTGNRALTGFTAPKIVWVKNHEPEIYKQIAHVLLPKDYIRFKLSGDYACDMSDASGMVLLDVANRRWSDEVLSALDIPAAWMPALYEGPEVSGFVSEAGAAETGLKAGTPIVGGGGDQAAGAVGVGAVRSGIVGMVVGTSGVVFAPLSSYAYEPEGKLHAFCHAVPGMWHFMGVMLSAAGSLQWYRDTLAPGVDFGTLTDKAASVPAGSEGLFFMPYLTGERTPHPDPLARAGFIGLTTRHTQAHMTRAVLEGVAFGLRDSFELICASEAGREISRIHVSGGGAKSPIWRQIMADILNRPMVTVEAVEGAAYGAALLAGVGAGIWTTVAETADLISLGDEVHPGEAVSAYEDAYQIYRTLYPLLADTFKKL